YWSLEADLAKRLGRPRRDEDVFRAALSKIAGEKAELHTGEETQQVVEGLAGADYVVREVKTRQAQRRPSPPFTTSTLQHEALRPAVVGRDPEAVRPYLSNMQYRLYRLIWQRFVASQMRPALLDNTTVDVDAGRGLTAASTGVAPYTFRATGSVITFPGFLAVYREGRDDGRDDELDGNALPPLAAGEPLDLVQLVPEQHFTQPPPRFTEAS